MDRCIFSRLTTRFLVGCVTRNDDPKPGRPKTSTDEGIVELVAEVLADVLRATFEKISRTTGISPTSVFRILT